MNPESFRGSCHMDITDNMELVLGLFERKSPHLFEERLVPGLTFEDLDPSTFKFCRNAAATLNPLHPWQDMTDMEILESCRLIKKDNAGKVEGFKYAALLLFGTDDAIANHLPRYKFELLYHKMTYACRYSGRLLVIFVLTLIISQDLVDMWRSFMTA